MPVRGRCALAFALAGCSRAEQPPAPAPAPAPVRSDAAAPPAATPPPDVGAIHGTLEEVSGQRILTVWGTPRQMGVAHGHLLRDEILEIVDGYALDVIPPATLQAARTIYTTTADIPERLREEADGVIEGMQAAGGAHVDALDRDLTAGDLLVLNAMTDLLAIGCSSVSAWGPVTEGDPALAGAPVVVRNLDWDDDPELLHNQLLIVYQPDDPARQPVVSVAFAGYLGCLSCMNEAGVTTLFNMGYGDGAASLGQALAGFAPANLRIRDALERRDVDGDGATTADDIEADLRTATHAGSWILHVLEPTAPGRAPARVLEVEADGVVRRDPGDRLGANTLAATNHLRAKASPRPGRRWRAIERTAADGTALDHAGLWALGTKLRLPEVVYTLLAEPDTRRLQLWLRRPGDAPDASTAPVAHDLGALMARAH